jgi:CheY-like chemotaxis protein
MKKILIIDDDEDISKILDLRLSKTGFDIEVAQNGKEGISMLKKEKFDLILLDLKMPVMDGHEFCEIVNNDDVFRNIPIIVLTVITEPTALKLKEDLKVKTVINKPIDPQELLDEINKYIG